MTARGTHGTIYIEADVNTDGDITDTKLITNTTGADNLAGTEHARAEALEVLSDSDPRRAEAVQVLLLPRLLIGERPYRQQSSGVSADDQSGRARPAAAGRPLSVGY